MCLKPYTLDNGVNVGCRDCWQCETVMMDDWAGRVRMEALSCDWFYRLDLTYDDKINAVSAKVLNYRDVQLFLKRLRKAGFNVRYLVAGEYGSDKGRAHWHMCLMGRGEDPYGWLPYRKRVRDEYWQQGIIFKVNANTQNKIRYVVKYALKDAMAKKGKSHAPLRMSKKPLLGANYIEEMAWKHAKAGIAPQDFRYTLGDRTTYLLRGSSVDFYVKSFVKYWELMHGKNRSWDSEVIDEHLDKMERKEMRAKGLDSPEMRVEHKFRAGKVKPALPYPGVELYQCPKTKYYAVIHPVLGCVERFRPDDKGEWRWLSDAKAE